MTFLSTSGCAEDPVGVPVCTLGTIPAGSSAGFAVSVSTDLDASGTVTNVATVSSASVNDPDPSNNIGSQETTINPPAAPPAAPSTLSARAALVGKGRSKSYAGFVRLAWSDNSDDEDEFVIERCDQVALSGNGKKQTAVCSGAWGLVLTASVGSDTTSFDDYTAQGGSAYVYRVKAVNPSGSSPYSNPADVVTP
jgi:hypothetical protein